MAGSGGCAPLPRDRDHDRGIECEPRGLRLTVRTDWPEGCVVQVRAPHEDSRATVNGAAVECTVRDQHGARWIYVAVPAGSSEVVLSW